MGLKSSTLLQEEDIEELQNETGCKYIWLAFSFLYCSAGEVDSSVKLYFFSLTFSLNVFLFVFVFFSFSESNKKALLQIFKSWQGDKGHFEVKIIEIN